MNLAKLTKLTNSLYLQFEHFFVIVSNNQELSKPIDDLLEIWAD